MTFNWPTFGFKVIPFLTDYLSGHNLSKKFDLSKVTRSRSPKWGSYQTQEKNIWKINWGLFKLKEISWRSWWHFMTYDNIWWHFMTKHVVYHDISDISWQIRKWIHLVQRGNISKMWLHSLQLIREAINTLTGKFPILTWYPVSFLNDSEQ